MTIEVKQEPSMYYGHFYEHIEFGGIYQVVFKPTKQKRTVVTWEF